MIIYIHGYGGSGEGTKARIFRELLKDKGIIAPSLSYVPTLAINTLQELVRTFLKYEKVYLIGSSLGGYYATYLANQFNIKAVLLNPAVNPANTLKEVTQDAPNFFDNSSFKWNQNHVDMLKQYDVLNLKDELYMLLAQKGDELLDYKEAANKFKNSKQILQEGGDHSFEGVENLLGDILEFFNIK
jgi:predicted esterase YcpF (UPF0227 family)